MPMLNHRIESVAYYANSCRAGERKGRQSGEAGHIAFVVQTNLEFHIQSKYLTPSLTFDPKGVAMSDWQLVNLELSDKKVRSVK